MYFNKLYSADSSPHSRTSDALRPFLGNNLPPLDMEAAAIRGVLAAAREHLAGTKALITEAEANLLQLKKDGEMLENLVHEHEVVLSPIRRFSPEILGEIYLYTVESPVGLDTKTGPWPISHVSRLWRATALSLPWLWSNISIHHATSNHIPKLALSILATILPRAGSAYLDIIFDVQASTSVIAKTAHLLEFLAASSHRWRSFHFKSGHAFIVHLEQVAGNVPHLERLRVNVPPHTGPTRLFRMFDNAPKLREVILDQAQDLRIGLPWAQIERLDPGANGSYPLELLRRSSNVIELTIHGDDDQCPSATESFIRLERLHQLNVSGGGQMLDNIIVPSLDGLYFRGSFTQCLIDGISNLFARAPCRLTRLKLEIPVDSTERLLPSTWTLLHLLSVTLVEFDLTIVPTTPNISGPALMLTMLSRTREHRRYIFPLLSTLTIDIHGTAVKFNTNEFVGGILSRITPAPPNNQSTVHLKSLRFRIDPVAEPLTLSTISSLPSLWRAD